MFKVRVRGICPPKSSDAKLLLDAELFSLVNHVEPPGKVFECAEGLRRMLTSS